MPSENAEGPNPRGIDSAGDDLNREITKAAATAIPHVAATRLAPLGEIDYVLWLFARYGLLIAVACETRDILRLFPIGTVSTKMISIGSMS